MSAISAADAKYLAEEAKIEKELAVEIMKITKYWDGKYPPPRPPISAAENAPGLTAKERAMVLEMIKNGTLVGGKNPRVVKKPKYADWFENIPE